MINIIKKGELPSKKTYITNCYKCRTEFSYQQEDIKFDQREGSIVKCPLCGDYIDHIKGVLKKD